jgi:hypothetical protein
MSASAKHLEVSASALLNSGLTALVVGVNNNGFTNVKLHDSADSSGPVVVQVTTTGVTSWTTPVIFKSGCYVEVTGTGTVSIWLA